MKRFILGLLACFVLQAAVAQDAASPETESDSLDSVVTAGDHDTEYLWAGESDSLDFVVTAGRTREEAAKVSAQVTVITAEDIAGSGATSVTDLLNTVPGMSLNRDETGAGFSVSARGYSSVDGRKKVLILVDGMRFNTLEGKTQVAWDAINLSEIERIEVLDGGQRPVRRQRPGRGNQHHYQKRGKGGDRYYRFRREFFSERTALLPPPAHGLGRIYDQRRTPGNPGLSETYGF